MISEHNVDGENLMSSGGFSGDERRLLSPDEAFDGQFDAEALYLKPGDVRFSPNKDEMLVASLGAGVVVSIYDVHLGIGAMAYILLSNDILSAFPNFDSVDPKLMEEAFKPIEDCLGEMKRRGAGKNRIRIQISGGANLPGTDDDRGTKNYVFVREALSRRGLQVFKEDLGGDLGRRIHFFPKTGRFVRKTLRRESDCETIRTQEYAFQ